MRLRRLFSAVALATVAACGLTACQTNVGAAAFVGSTKISESDVHSYLTPSAVPSTGVDASGQPTTTDPTRSVIDALILNELFVAALKASPSGLPSASALATAQAQVLSSTGATEAQVRQEFASEGYSSSYYELAVGVQARLTILETELKDTGNDAEVLAAILKLKIPVRVSPRYGTWTASTLRLSGGPAIPDFLTLQSSATAATGA